MKRKKLYPFCILALCFLIQGGLLGIISNCRGVFYDPICAELNIELGKLTTYSVFYGFAVCLAIPLASRAIKKWNLRCMLTGFAVLTAAVQYAMSYFQSAYQWYIAAAIQGVCYAFLFVQTVPMLINNWFSERSGFFLGIACSASGIVGAVMNPLAQQFMAAFGWRATYKMLGVVLFVLLVPACALFSVRKPGDAGAQPYRRTHETKHPVRTPVFHDFSDKRTVFLILLVFAGTICITTGYNQMLFGIGLTFDHPKEMLSSFVSASMVGTIACKLLVGWLNDRYGMQAVCYTSVGVIGVGLVCLLFGQSTLRMYLGSFCMGMPMAVTVVAMPNLVRSIFGALAFEKRYRTASVVVNLVSNFSFTVLGWIVSIFDSYRVMLAFGIGVSALSALLAATLFAVRKRSLIHE